MDDHNKVEKVQAYKTTDGAVFHGVNGKKSAGEHQKHLDRAQALADLKTSAAKWLVPPPNSVEKEGHFMRKVRAGFDPVIQLNPGKFVQALVELYAINPGGFRTVFALIDDYFEEYITDGK